MIRFENGSPTGLDRSIFLDTIEITQATDFANADEALIIQGVLDLDISGGKAIELKALSAVPSLSYYSLGVANNGGGTDGMEIDSLPHIALVAGDTFWVVYRAAGLATYFGADSVFATGTEGVDYTSHARVDLNGDDAVELFLFSRVVDVFGNANQDGTHTAWEYKDSWAYRRDGSQASSTFDVTQWMIPGTAGDQCSDGSTSNCNSRCGPYPSFQGNCHIGACDGSVSNGDFEHDRVADYRYMTPTDWSDGGGGGLVVVPSGNGPWGGLAAPDQGFYLAIQEAGKFAEQVVCGLQPHTSYVLSFSLTHRPGYGADEQAHVEVDGTTIWSSPVPLSGSWTSYTAPFTTGANDPVLRFENDSPSGDRTVFVDMVAIAPAQSG